MTFLKGIVNTLADPRLFFFIIVGALVALVWKREKAASNAFGYGVLGGCGLADTGAAAAGSAASAAQQAAEAKRTEQRVREQIEAANREAAERERAAADAASR